MKIYKKGTEILTKVAKPVDLSKGVGTDLVMLTAKMLDTMYAARGCGLAAPQIGKSIQLIVVDCSNDENTPFTGVMINPKITNKEGSQSSLEGCLSLPNRWFKLERANKITVEYIDIIGDTKIIDLEGPVAAVIQHEINHLEGKLLDQIGEQVDKDSIF